MVCQPDPQCPENFTYAVPSAWNTLFSLSRVDFACFRSAQILPHFLPLTTSNSFKTPLLRCCQVTSVVSDTVWPHRRQPTRLPWDSPGKNTGVGCHFLLQCMKVKSESEVAQSCPTLSDPMDCSPPGSSIHGTFQAGVLEWGAIAFSLCYTLMQFSSPCGQFPSQYRKAGCFYFNASTMPNKASTQ